MFGLFFFIVILERHAVPTRGSIDCRVKSAPLPLVTPPGFFPWSCSALSRTSFSWIAGIVLGNDDKKRRSPSGLSRGSMDCRNKSGNDSFFSPVMFGLFFLLGHICT